MQKNINQKKQRKKSKFNKKHQYNLDSVIENEIKKNLLRTDFPKNIINEQQLNKVNKGSDHQDYTHIPFITIDGEDSKDFDDAVYAIKKKSHIEIMVAIADVSFFVKQDDPIDIEAKKRGNSYYFPNKVIPMLPELLSNNICSLVPNKERLCIIVIAKIDIQGKIISSKIIRGVIKSRARMTYREVELYIKKKCSQKKDYHEILKNLELAYLVLSKKSKNRGKIDFDLEDYKIIKSKDDSSFIFSKNENYTSEKIIEELMIFANNIVASYFIKKKKKSIYRNHEKPSEEKLLKLKNFLRLMGIDFSFNGIVNQDDFLDILKKSEHKQFKTIKEMILRTQSKAYYHYKNIGHFGLALEDYTHFTSPIRRYSDLIVHRNISNNFLNNNSNDDICITDSLCTHLLEQEKKGELIERSIRDKACCLYLKKIKKKDFTGFIDGLTEFGIFIKANELPFSGLIRLNNLHDDFYSYDSNKICMVGRNHGRLYKIGQKVSFRIKSTNIIKGQISLNKMRVTED
jgi:ribonuclease R